VAWIAEHAGGDEESSGLRLNLAQLPGTATASVRVTPERLFGRHCAVLGATGGGKSWTLARIVESCTRFDAKVLLLDATGEYYKLRDGVRHVSLGSENDRPNDACEMVSLPYRMLAEEDLFSLFRPAGQVQAPRLRAAMRSLKLAALVPQNPIVHDGCIPKAERQRAPYDTAYQQFAAQVDVPAAAFDLELLAQQIALECVYPSAWGSARGVKDYSRWGGDDDQAFNQCTSLIGRVESYLATPQFAPLLRPGNAPNVIEVIEEWLAQPDTPVLRISLRHLAFTAGLREIVVNGIGRSLLTMARTGAFEARPLVVCLDEAHQFLNKSLGDDYSKYPLDAFDLVAKEGRKYSLSLCIATQRPRDIPDSVLGQMGTLIVHRLTNDSDRYVVERASGDIDRSAAAFLPALAPGQALLLGVEYPIPLVIRITPPTEKPDSKGPDYQRHWRRRSDKPVLGPSTESPADDPTPEPPTPAPA
jgi:hypothetical protein